MTAVNVKCKKKHLMEVQFSCPYLAGYVFCDTCKQPNIHHHDYFYHCKHCKYDICARCSFYMCQPPMLDNPAVKSSLHGHIL